MYLKLSEKDFLLTQPESQKIDFIIPVVDYFIDYKEASIPELEQKLGILRKSLERTIKQLINLELIKIKEIQDRGRRNYSYKSKNRLKQYRKFLGQEYDRKFTGLEVFEEKRFKKNIDRIWSKIIKKIHHSSTKYNRFNKNDLRKKFKIKSALLQKKITKIQWPNEISIRDIKYHHAKKIQRDYGEGRICNVCLNEYKILDYFKTNYMDSQLGCSEGHFIKIHQTPETFMDSLQVSDSDKQIWNNMLKSKKINKYKKNYFRFR